MTQHTDQVRWQLECSYCGQSFETTAPPGHKPLTPDHPSGSAAYPCIGANRTGHRQHLIDNA